MTETAYIPEDKHIAYIRLADYVADAMQKGLLDGQEFYGLYEAMEEVDPHWRTR